MPCPSLRSALTEYFGEEAEIASPEDGSEAWRAIVDDCRRGSYPDLQSEIERILRRSDQEILEFFRSCAPAWKCDGPRNARHSLEVFYSYIDTYAR
jgi:hypothetical protein